MAEPDPAVQERKAALRAEILAARATRSESERVAAGAALAAGAASRLAEARTVAAYLAFGTEPPTADLLASLVQAGRRVVVPVVEGDALDWVDYDAADPPAAGGLGIPEPVGMRLGVAALEQVEVILVPALAADRRGNRLGRGRGFYDRALASVSARVIAVVFDDELRDAVPVEPHDRRVDAVLTPARWHDVGGE